MADEPRAYGVEIAGATADLGLGFGLWGLLLALPGVIIWLWRRLRRFTESAVGDAAGDA